MAAAKGNSNVAAKAKAQSATVTKKQDKSVADLMAGGQERDLAFIYNPENGEEGALLFGRLVSSEERVLDPKMGRPATCLTFAPALHVRPGEETEPLRAASTVMSASLGLRITPAADIGKCFAIRYDGKQESEKGGRAPFRIYTVVEQPVAKLKAALTAIGAQVLADSIVTE